MIKDLVTILVPIYNETQGVEQLLKKTEKLKINKEIIVLNDGSTNPKTLQILTDLKSHFPKIIFYDAKKNNGKTKVITQGIRMASGNICVILDSDSELDPTDISHLYAELKKKDAHFVNGIRYLPHRKHPWNISYAITQASRVFFGAVMRLFLGVRIVDVMCGYKMFYTADFVKYAFSSSRFGLETELLGETIRRKRKIVQVPVRYYPRTYKEGKKIQLHDGVEVLRGLLHTSSRYAVTKIVAISLFLFFIAFFSFNISASYFDTTDSAPTNYTALNIIFNRRLDLTNLKSDIARAGIISTTVTNSKGMVFGKTPPILGILSVPPFIVFNTYFGVHEMSGTQIVRSDYHQYVGKIIASLYAALSSVILFLLIRRLINGTRVAFLMACVYALGTSVFNTASQANWQHAISLFYITALLFILFTFRHRKIVLFLCGVIVGLLFEMRVSSALYMPFIFIFVYLQTKTIKVALRQYLIISLGFTGVYIATSLLYRYYGVPYGYSQEFVYSIKLFSISALCKNIFSLLFSLNFGLFVYSPILLLSFLYFFKNKINLEKKEMRFVVSLLPTLVLFITFAGFWWMWIGGTSLEARLLSESLPIFIILLSFVYLHFSHNYIFKVLFIIFFIYSVAINISTTYMMDWLWFPLYTKPGYVYQLQNAWYHRPSLLMYVWQKRVWHQENFERKDGSLYIHKTAYRFNVNTNSLVKLEDSYKVLIK